MSFFKSKPRPPALPLESYDVEELTVLDNIHVGQDEAVPTFACEFWGGGGDFWLLVLVLVLVRGSMGEWGLRSWVLGLRSAEPRTLRVLGE